MLWGHRNDPEGMKQGLEEFDAWLGGFLRAACAAGDLLLITADHGNDPTTPSTDHSREQVPLLARLVGCRAGRATWACARASWMWPPPTPISSAPRRRARASASWPELSKGESA